MKKNKSVSIIIPARYDSTRFPGKLLKDLKGKTVIQRVYEQCKKVKGIKEVYIATDSDKIKRSCELFTDSIIMTKKHSSGTDRIAEASEIISSKYIINVQGDEPFIKPKLIEKLIRALKGEKMVTCYHKIKEQKDLFNPNIVKVIKNKKEEAIYFSRSVIPFDRDNMSKALLKENVLIENNDYYKHIGIYGYKKSFLEFISKQEQTDLEQLESLEQLRVIELGYKIKLIETKSESIGIDTEEDYLEALNRI